MIKTIVKEYINQLLKEGEKMRKRINLLHVVYGVMSGGVEQMLINYFSGKEFNNYNLFIAYSNMPDEKCLNKLRKCGFTTIKLNSQTKTPLKYYNELKIIIKKNNINIVHANINIDNYLVLMAANSCGVKTRIAHSHGLPLSTKLVIKKVSRKIKKKLCKKYSTCNFACSEKAGKYLYENKEFNIIYNAINLDKFKYNFEIRKELRKKMNLENNIVVGYIARFSDGKNHPFLIEIFDQIVLENKNVKVIFIGSGHLKDEIQKMINDRNLKNNLIILNSKDDIYNYYQIMDLFVFPSTEEGLGMVAIESQINGVYCIASTGVPKDTKISNNIEFINFDKELWIAEIKKHLFIRTNKNNNKCNYEKYDINTQRNRLKEYYERELYNEK